MTADWPSRNRSDVRIPDNIAAAILWGVMARHVYKGRVRIAFGGDRRVGHDGGAGSVIGDTTKP